MPNLDAALRFISDAERLESRLVVAALRALARARLELFNVLESGASVALVVASVGREVTAAADALAPRAGLLVERYLSAQLAGFVDAPAAPLVGGELAPFAGGLPAWQAATVGRFATGVQQLAGDNPAAIAAALTDPTSPASAYSWARNGLQLATEGALWAGLNGALGRAYGQLPPRSGRRFQKQALAAIDKRTTRCCLEVHGQIVDLDKPFRTGAAPAYAGEQQQPPFHYRCRTVIALYHPAMEAVGPSTEQLRASARAELTDR